MIRIFCRRDYKKVTFLWLIISLFELHHSSKRDISRLRVDKRDVGLEAWRSKHLSSANNLEVLATA